MRVLFLCTHNSARSQMAEAILRGLGGDRFKVESAGTRPGGVHPMAISTMAKRGIELRGHRSKPVDELAGESFDWVITVCDAANQACPIFAGAHERMHWSVDDPVAVKGTAAQRAAAFERAADELARRIQLLIDRRPERDLV